MQYARIRFPKKEWSLLCFLDGELFYEADEIAILIDFDPPDNSIALKHGSKENIEKRMREMRKAFIERGFPEMAEFLRTISHKEWDLKILNRI